MNFRHITLYYSNVIVFVFSLITANADARGKQLYAGCVSCHGPDGHGVPKLRSPQIAGQHGSYVEDQLLKFKNGFRGSHPKDTEGLKMKAFVLMLPTNEDVKKVSNYIATFKPIEKKPTFGTGKAEKGKTLYTDCLLCHGDKAQGKPELKSPSLQHLQDWYMLAQLKKFKDGVRGGNPNDITGSQMRLVAANLTDEQAMKDVIAYIQTISK